MKRRTARQLVAQLADLRNLARCSALRASSASSTMMQSSLEGAGRKTPDVPSEADEVGQESFVGAAHEIHA
jgi:hypothetical protein